jgi:hypothetical protein
VVSHDTVLVDLSAGRATLQVRDLTTKDFVDFENACLGNGPRPRPGKVSYVVRWTARGPVNVYDNPSQRYRASMRDATAQMEWTARTPDFEFQSAPLSTSASDYAELGFEQNGAYY